MVVQLNTIKPDFESLVSQLQQVLSTKSAWKDRYSSATGQALIEMIAGVGALDQYSIESAHQEAFLDSAKLDKSIISSTRGLGVRITRRRGASVTEIIERITPELAQLGDASKAAKLWVPLNGTISWDAVNSRVVLSTAALGSMTQVLRTVPGEPYNLYFTSDSNLTTRIRCGSTPISSNLLDSVISPGYNHVTYTASSEVTYVTMYSTSVLPNGYIFVSSISNKRRLPGVTIPAFSQFTSNSASGTSLLFNETSIQFTPDEYTKVVTLKEGTVVRNSFFGTGDNFQFFVSSEKDFTVDDASVFVSINGISIPIVTNGVWNYKGKPAVQDSTYRNGELILTFGTDLYGSLPRSTDAVSIGYTVTKGLDGNNVHFFGEKAVFSMITLIDGVGLNDLFESTAQSSLLGGTNHTSMDVYRSVSPFLYSSKGSAITKQELQAECLNYPGVLDAKVFGQRDLSLTDPTFMNLVKISLVAVDAQGQVATWSDPQWKLFFDWLETKSIYGLRFYKDNPTPLVVNIDADVYCKAASDLTQIRSNIIQSLNTLFAPKFGILGYNIYASDLNNTVVDSDASVQYVRFNTPSGEILSEIPSPSNTQTRQVSGGTLPAGDYTYGVLSVRGAGKTLVRNPVNISTLSAGTIRVSWDSVPGVTSYEVYGRTIASFGLLGVVPAGTTFYDDVSATVVGIAQPNLDTIGVSFPQLGTVNLNMYYTDRPSRVIL